MKDTIHIETYTGKDMAQWIPELAKLRIEVFAEYPFLYQGELRYEMDYLQKFTKLKDGVMIVAFDGDVVIGASTGYPFVFEQEQLVNVLVASGRKPEEYFGLGESVLKKEYRGQGIGKRFFEKREAHVSRLGRFKHICFFTSLRPKDDPRRPADWRPLGPFWQSRGFVEHPELVGVVEYPEIGETKKSPKKMVFWIKDLQGAATP